jgi:hypothetical protein
MSSSSCKGLRASTCWRKSRSSSAESIRLGTLRSNQTIASELDPPWLLLYPFPFSYPPHEHNPVTICQLIRWSPCDWLREAQGLDSRPPHAVFGDPWWPVTQPWAISAAYTPRLSLHGAFCDRLSRESVWGVSWWILGRSLNPSIISVGILRTSLFTGATGFYFIYLQKRSHDLHYVQWWGELCRYTVIFFIGCKASWHKCCRLVAR